MKDSNVKTLVFDLKEKENKKVKEDISLLVNNCENEEDHFYSNWSQYLNGDFTTLRCVRCGKEIKEEPLPIPNF